MAQTTAALAARYFFVDLLGGIAMFPLWWYSRGTALTLAWARRSVGGASRATGFGVWARNLFVPMFGERGAEGRIISFFMRLVMVIFRGAAVAAWTVVVAALVLAYLFAPVAAAAGIVFNASGVL